MPIIRNTASDFEHQFEKDLETLFLTDSNQKRNKMNKNSILTLAAQSRVNDFGAKNYFNHINKEGYGPDYICELFGYKLPKWYNVTKNSNHIESIAAGYISAEDAWQALAYESPLHARHVLGLHPFFKAQEEYGIGYTFAPNSKYNHYYCIMTAHKK